MVHGNGQLVAGRLLTTNEPGPHAGQPIIGYSIALTHRRHELDVFRWQRRLDGWSVVTFGHSRRDDQIHPPREVPEFGLHPADPGLDLVGGLTCTAPDTDATGARDGDRHVDRRPEAKAEDWMGTPQQILQSAHRPNLVVGRKVGHMAKEVVASQQTAR